MNKEEILKKVKRFIEKWKETGYPRVRITFEGASFVLSDIIETRSLSYTSAKFNKITFVNYLTGPRDIECAIDKRSILFERDQERLDQVLFLLEQELNKH